MKYYDKKIGIDIFNVDEYKEFIKKCTVCDADMTKVLAPIVARFTRSLNIALCDRTARLLHELTGFDVEWDVELCKCTKDEKEMLRRLKIKQSSMKDKNGDTAKFYNSLDSVISSAHEHTLFSYEQPIGYVDDDRKVRVAYELCNINQDDDNIEDTSSDVNSIDELQYEIEPCTFAVRLKMHMKNGGCIGLKVHSSLWNDLDSKDISESVVMSTLNIVYWLVNIVKRCIPGYEPVYFDVDLDGVEYDDSWDDLAEKYDTYRKDNGENREKLVELITEAIRYNMGVITGRGYIMRQNAAIYANVAAELYFSLTAKQIQVITSLAASCIHNSNKLRKILQNVFEDEIKSNIPRKVNGIDVPVFSSDEIKKYYANRTKNEKYANEIKSDVRRMVDRAILWTTELNTVGMSEVNLEEKEHATEVMAKLFEEDRKRKKVIGWKDYECDIQKFEEYCTENRSCKTSPKDVLISEISKKFAEALDKHGFVSATNTGGYLRKAVDELECFINRLERGRLGDKEPVSEDYIYISFKNSVPNYREISDACARKLVEQAMRDNGGKLVSIKDLHMHYKWDCDKGRYIADYSVEDDNIFNKIVLEMDGEDSVSLQIGIFFEEHRNLDEDDKYSGFYDHYEYVEDGDYIIVPIDDIEMKLRIASKQIKKCGYKQWLRYEMAFMHKLAGILQFALVYANFGKDPDAISPDDLAGEKFRGFRHNTNAIKILHGYIKNSSHVSELAELLKHITNNNSGYDDKIVTDEDFKIAEANGFESLARATDALLKFLDKSKDILKDLDDYEYIDYT